MMSDLVLQGEMNAPIKGMVMGLTGMGDKFKLDDSEDLSPCYDLEKATVLQGCRVFHDSSVVTHEPARCCQLITNLLYLMNKGETLSSTEVTDVFFGVTKLFQSHEPSLRRMVYLFIKEVAATTNPDDVIIVTAPLTKDMNSPQDLYKANSIRVLACIIDATMLGAIERYVKQAIVDKNPLVASSALISSHAFYSISPDVVRRWVNEAQEAVSHPHGMVQYHALSLLYQIKQRDRLGVSKMVTQLSKSLLRSPLAMCLLIRYTTRILQEDLTATNARAAYQFMERCLRHKSEMVMYEAARAICNLPSVEESDLQPAITTLQLFLSSPKVTLKYGAIRILSKVASKHPLVIVRCNDDMEALMSDSNRGVATLAITTLLKTGQESSIDRLMAQISSFMGDIADGFKVTIVHAIKDLCVKYPSKHRVLIGFLAVFLREEGGCEFKKAITDSIIQLMQTVPDTRETSLFHLCDYIEDCEFTTLCTHILYLVGSLGPEMTAPARYIRFVYNRVILENASIRASAISALAKFGARVPELRESIVIMIKHSAHEDEDDEVRDRACVALKLLTGNEEASLPCTAEPQMEDPGDFSSVSDHGSFSHDNSSHSNLLLDPLPRSLSSIDKALKQYASHMTATEGQALTFGSLPVVEEPPAQPGVSDVGESGPSIPGQAMSADIAPLGDSSVPFKEEADDVAAALYAIPELASLGRVFRSSSPVPLTENETEYVVQCVKHVFEDHLVLDFSIHNTIEDQRLTDVVVALDSGGENEIYTLIGSIPLPVLNYGKMGHTYAVFKRNTDARLESVAFSCEMQFKVIDVDPTSGETEDGDEGFSEVYVLEELEVSTADYMAKVSVVDFQRSWQEMGPDTEVIESFSLQFRGLADAVSGVIDFLGMQPCDSTHLVPAVTDPSKPHMLHLSGVFIGNVSVLARAQLKLGGESGGTLLRIAVRSEDPDVSQLVADFIN